MSITKLLYGLAALPLLAGVASAEPAKQSTDVKAAKQPLQLSDNQMDKVTAGWDLFEVDIYNTGFTVVSIYQRGNSIGGILAPGNNIIATGAYLDLRSPAISIASWFGR